jgi:hypothetical protein
MMMLQGLLYYLAAAPGLLTERWYWAFLLGQGLWVGTGVALCVGFLAQKRRARHLATAIDAAALLYLAWTAFHSLVTGRWDTPWAGTLIVAAIGLYCAAILAFCLSPAGRRLLAR